MKDDWHESSNFMNSRRSPNTNNSKISNSLNLEFEQSKNNMEEEFQFVSLDENYKNQSRSLDDKVIGSSFRNLIKESIIVEKETEKIESPSIWSSLSNKISNIKNTLKYNIITTNSYVNFHNLKYVKIFDKIFTEEEIKNGKLNANLATLFQMTYRSEFPQLIHPNKIYTSDCGWGCMIRVAQMMLAKAVLENKISHLEKNRKEIFIDEEIFTKLRIETLLMFFDSNLKIEDVRESQDFEYFFRSFLKLVKEEENFKKLEKAKRERIKLSQDKIMNNFEFLASQHEENSVMYAYEIIPPFSIQNICKLGASYDKLPGDWYSDVLMASILSRLNDQFKAIENIKILNFNEGIIDENIILENCFEELKCLIDCQCESEIKLSNNKSEDYSNDVEEFIKKLGEESLKENNLCNECREKILSSYQKENSSRKIIEKSNKLYKLKKGGIILVSVRHGLGSISKEYFPSIRNLFSIPYNLGILGGKKSSALYLIGLTDTGNLIYLDPHVNQVAVKDKISLESKIQLETYAAKYFYQIELKNISPAFTAAFYFRDEFEYDILMKHLNNHASLTYPVFMLRTEENSTNTEYKRSSKLKIETSREEDGFCIIEYEDEFEEDNLS